MVRAPNACDVLMNQAQGMLAEAKRCYLEAIRINPCFAIAWSNLAGIFKEEVSYVRQLVFRVSTVFSFFLLFRTRVFVALFMRGLLSSRHTPPVALLLPIGR